MDPELEQLVTTLFRKAQAARTAGQTVTPENMNAWMQRESKGKYGLTDAQNYVADAGRHLNAGNLGRAFAQGATYNFGDEATGAVQGPDAEAEMRLKDAAFQQAHPVINGVLHTAGNAVAPIVAALAAPEALGGATAGVGGLALRSMLLGGLPAAADAAGGANGTVGDRAKAAGIAGPIGAATAGLASLGGSAIGRIVGKVGDYFNPEGAVSREAATQIPPDAAATLARQETLAPGTAVPAQLSSQMRQMTRVVGADPTLSATAPADATSRLAQITAAKQALGPKYDLLGEIYGKVPVDKDLHDILRPVGEDMPYTKEVGLQDLQRLRSRFRVKADRASGPPAHDFGQFVDKLTGWMEQKFPGVASLDSHYGFLSEAERQAGDLAENLTKTGGNYAATRAAGGEAGSIGASLPAGSRGVASKLFSTLFPGTREARAKAVNSLLLQPGADVAPLLAQRQAIFNPPPPSVPSVLRPAVAGTAGDAISRLLNLWGQRSPLGALGGNGP